MNSNYSYLLNLRNLQEQVKKAFFYQKLFWTFTVLINCSSGLNNFANTRLSFSWSLEHFFLTIGQNNFDNKIPFAKKLRQGNNGSYRLWEFGNRLLLYQAMASHYITFIESLWEIHSDVWHSDSLCTLFYTRQARPFKFF